MLTYIYALLRTHFFAAPGALCHDTLLPPRIKTTYRNISNNHKSIIDIDDNDNVSGAGQPGILTHQV